LELDTLIKACKRMQQWWSMVMMMAAPNLPTPEKTPKQQSTDSDLLNTINYLKEFIHLDTMDDWLDDQPPALNVHWLPMSFNDTLVLQTKVMEKLIVMIGNLSAKIDLLINATTCPQKSPFYHIMNNPTIPVIQTLSCTMMSPQPKNVLGPMKPPEIYCHSAKPNPPNQTSPSLSHPHLQKCYPSQTPFHPGCSRPTMTQTKDSMHPP